MAVDNKHHLYVKLLPDWQQLEDCHEGQRTIKGKTTQYLPATPGMVRSGVSSTGAPGAKAYSLYISVALFPDFVKDAVESLVGIMHREEAAIELPEKMQGLLTSATSEGEGLHALLRKVNEAQLLYGRYGLLVEVPNGKKAGEVMPYIVTYDAKQIINWDAVQSESGRRDKTQLVVLDESDYERTSQFDWEKVTKYRVLQLARAEDFGEGVEMPADGGQYIVAVARQDGEGGGLEVDNTSYIAPSIAGKTADSIPFTFINSNDLVAAPDTPPLLGVSNLAIAVYRGEADYRQSLYQQGQETLVIIGREPEEEGKETKVGSDTVLDVPLGGDAKYIGVSADGLQQMADTIRSDKELAQQKGSQLLNNATAGRESGEALKIRVAAATTTLTTIAKAGASGLEQSLKQIAVWLGLNPDDVKVEPNMDFAEDPLTGQDVLALMQAKAMGAPLSRQSLHRIFKQRDLTEMTFEDEQAILEEEIESDLLAGGVVDDDPFAGGNAGNNEGDQGNSGNENQGNNSNQNRG